MVTDLKRFGVLSVLDASAYEHFNTDIKKAVRRTSQRKQHRMEEAVAVLSDPFGAGPSTNPSTQQVGVIQDGRKERLEKDGCFLVRDGMSTTLLQLKNMTRGGCQETRHESTHEVLNDIVQLFTGDSLEVFIPLLQDLISDDIAHFHDGDVHLQFVQSVITLQGIITYPKTVLMWPRKYNSVYMVHYVSDPRKRNILVMY